MTSRYTVWLNDVSLESLDPAAVYISDIAYEALAPEWQNDRYMGRDGSYSYDGGIEKNVVTVTFEVRHYNTVRRQEAVQEIAKWAADGGWLQTSDRPGQQLRVRCTRLPGIGSVMRWTDTLQVEFTAFELPYWQDIIPRTAEIEDGETGTLFNPGVRPAWVEVKVTAQKAITGFTVSVGDTEIQLTNISVSKDAWVDIRYTADRHILEIVRSDGTSLLHKRTAASDDDLIAQPGNNEIECSADVSCVFSVKGVWV